MSENQEAPAKRSHKKSPAATPNPNEQIVDVTCCFCQNKGKAIVKIDDAGQVVAVTIKS